MSIFGKKHQGEREARRAIAIADAEKAAAIEEQKITDGKKKLEQQKINRKSVAAARASFRRPGFLDSQVEGTKDVLG